MTLSYSSADFSELVYGKPAQSSRHNLLLDEFELLYEVPKCIGQGYIREIELSPGLWLEILNYEYHDRLTIKAPVHDHLVQFMILSSGLIHHNEVYPTLGGNCSYLSGSGIAPSCVAKFQKSQRITGIDVHIKPELLEALFSRDPGQSPNLKLLVKDNDWKVSFFPETTLAMQVAVQQILNSPFQGVTRRLYLQAKVFELLAMQLEPILADHGQYQSVPRLKPETIARLHHAKEILAARLEHPPSSVELAQQVGVSDRTLRRGFQELFGTTVFGYLTHQRMEQAAQLLREGNMTVAEVANLVGYSHLGHFAAAFRRKFGITPNQCLMGRKFVRRL